MIEAVFRKDSTKVYTKSLTQHDKGQLLKFIGVHLPEVFEVHFSNDSENGVATVVRGEDNIVAIPDAYLATGEYVRAWLYDEHEETSYKTDYHVDEEILYEDQRDPVTWTKGTTLYQVVIPVIRRPLNIVMPMPGMGEPTKEYEVDGESLHILEK